MIAASLSDNELGRIHALHALNILDTQSDERFDSITRFAAHGFNVPISLVSLVDTKRQWFKSKYGLDKQQTPRTQSFCAHAILNDVTNALESRIFEIYDTHNDARFKENPLVVGEPWMRSYIGYILQSESKMNLGTLCLIDTKPKQFTDGEKYLLMILGTMAENLINGKHHATGIEKELRDFH